MVVCMIKERRYLRQCRDCNEIYRGKTRYSRKCSKCKERAILRARIKMQRYYQEKRLKKEVQENEN
jgi:hypothetical protein